MVLCQKMSCVFLEAIITFHILVQIGFEAAVMVRAGRIFFNNHNHRSISMMNRGQFFVCLYHIVFLLNLCSYAGDQSTLNNADVLVSQTDGKVVALPTAQRTIEVVTPKAQSMGRVRGCEDRAKEQFLKPGEQWSMEGNQDSSSYGYEGKRDHIGAQGNVGDTAVSVGTDAGSVARFVRDLGTVLSSDADKKKASDVARTTQENAMKKQLRAVAEQTKNEVFGKSEEQLHARKTQIQKEMKQLSHETTAILNKPQCKHEQPITRKVRQQAHDRKLMEHRVLHTELNVINECLQGIEATKEAIKPLTLTQTNVTLPVSALTTTSNQAEESTVRIDTARNAVTTTNGIDGFARGMEQARRQRELQEIAWKKFEHELRSDLPFPGELDSSNWDKFTDFAKRTWGAASQVIKEHPYIAGAVVVTIAAGGLYYGWMSVCGNQSKPMLQTISTNNTMQRELTNPVQSQAHTTENKSPLSWGISYTGSDGKQRVIAKVTPVFETPQVSNQPINNWYIDEWYVDEQDPNYYKVRIRFPSRAINPGQSAAAEKPTTDNYSVKKQADILDNSGNQANTADTMQTSWYRKPKPFIKTPRFPVSHINHTVQNQKYSEVKRPAREAKLEEAAARLNNHIDDTDAVPLQCKQARNITYAQSSAVRVDRIKQHYTVPHDTIVFAHTYGLTEADLATMYGNVYEQQLHTEFLEQLNEARTIAAYYAFKQNNVLLNAICHGATLGIETNHLHKIEIATILANIGWKMLEAVKGVGDALLLYTEKTAQCIQDPKHAAVEFIHALGSITGYCARAVGTVAYWHELIEQGDGLIAAQKMDEVANKIAICSKLCAKKLSTMPARDIAKHVTYFSVDMLITHQILTLGNRLYADLQPIIVDLIKNMRKEEILVETALQGVEEIGNSEKISILMQDAEKNTVKDVLTSPAIVKEELTIEYALERWSKSEQLQELERQCAKIGDKIADTRLGIPEENLDILGKEYMKLEKMTLQKYEEIRNASNDIIIIAKNTGIDTDIIRQVKEHVFIKEHVLWDGIRRFDPEINMANAWERLASNTFLKSDLEFLKHEFAESILMGKHDVSWRNAHDITNKVYNWVAYLEGEI